MHGVSHATGFPYLYVADVGAASSGYQQGVIDVLHAGYYGEIGLIKGGVDYPNDVFLDKRGDLYVANDGGPDITEYTPGNWDYPVFTYSLDMNDPISVAVDIRGNVYESDVSPGYVNEYYPGRNRLIAHCRMPGGLYSEGVAVDSGNDVFTIAFGSGGETVYEYKGGLSGCKATALSISVLAQAVAVDKNSNLVLAGDGEVAIVDAPYYNTVNTTIGSGFKCPFSVHLNKTNALAFVSDPCNGTVTVVNYVTGVNEVVLGNDYGVEKAYAAVEQPNAVY
jgi:hypothetical protein